MNSPIHFSQRLLPRLIWQAIWLAGVAFLVFILLGLVSTTHVPASMFFGHLLFERAMASAIVAIPMAIIIAGGGFDFSIAGVVAAVGMAMAPPSSSMSGFSSPPASGSWVTGVIMAIFLSLVVGIINASLIGLARLPSAIVTLATGFTLLGGVYASMEIRLGGRFAESRELAPMLGILLFIALVLMLLAGLAWAEWSPLLKRTGEPGEKFKSWYMRALADGTPFIFSALGAGILGISHVSWFGVFSAPTDPLYVFFPILCAVVIGGTMYAGRCANLFGAVLACLAMEILSQYVMVEEGRSFTTIRIEALFLLLAAGAGWGYALFFQWIYARRQARMPALGFPLMTAIPPR